MRTRRLARSLLASLAVLAVAPTPVVAGDAAPTGASIRVLTSPPRILAGVAAGQVTTARLLVANQSREAVPLVVEVLDLAPAEGDSFATPVPVGEATRGAGAWVSVDRPAFMLGPGAQRTLEVTVRVPDEAGAGGHYAALVVQADPDSGDAVDLRLRLVTHVVVLVPGAIDYDARLEDVQLRRVGDGRVRLSARIENVGNIQVQPRDAAVEVSGRFGDRSVDIEVPELLPGGQRELEATIEVPSILDRYRGRIHMRLEDDQRVVARSGTTWAWRLPAAMPWLVAAAGVLVAAGVVVVLRRRREFRRLVRAELDMIDRRHDGDPQSEPPPGRPAEPRGQAAAPPPWAED